MASTKGEGEALDLNMGILIQIRDEIHKTNERLDTTNDRLDRLERRQSEDSVRLATEVLAVAKAVGEVRDLFRHNRLDRAKIENHERRITKPKNVRPDEVHGLYFASHADAEAACVFRMAMHASMPATTSDKLLCAPSSFAARGPK